MFFVQTVFFKISQSSRESTCVRDSSLPASSLELYQKIDSSTDFVKEFYNISTSIILWNTSGELLLKAGAIMFLKTKLNFIYATPNR